MTALEEIKKALEGATLYPGPWEVGELIKRRPYSDAWELQNATDLFGYIYCGHEAPEDVKPVVDYIAAVNPVAISELLSTLESLQRDNESLRDDVKREAELATHMANDCNDAQARAEAAEAEVKRLREVLEPFGRIGDEGRGSALSNDAPLAVVNANMPDLPQWLAKVRGVITQGDVRRARSVLASTGGEHHAE